MVDVAEALVNPVVLSKSADEAIFPTKSAEGDTEPIEVDSVVPSRIMGPVSPKKKPKLVEGHFVPVFYPNEERIYCTPLKEDSTQRVGL